MTEEIPSRSQPDLSEEAERLMAILRREGRWRRPLIRPDNPRRTAVREAAQRCLDTMNARWDAERAREILVRPASRRDTRSDALLRAALPSGEADGEAQQLLRADVEPDQSPAVNDEPVEADEPGRPAEIL